MQYLEASNRFAKISYYSSCNLTCPQHLSLKEEQCLAGCEGYPQKEEVKRRGKKEEREEGREKWRKGGREGGRKEGREGDLPQSGRSLRPFLQTTKPCCFDSSRVKEFKRSSVT